MATTIKLKNGSGAPLAGDLVQGEPALDLTNKRLYTEDAGGNVIEIGTSPSAIDINAGTIDGVTLGTNSAVTSAVITTADINGGTIDGTVIGGASAAAGTFTTIAGTQFSSDSTDVELKYSGSTKLATTNTGINVTGTITADGLTVESGSTLIATFEAPTIAIELQETDTTDQNTRLIHGTSAFYVQTVDDASSSTTSRFKVDHTTGDISFY